MHNPRSEWKPASKKINERCGVRMIVVVDGWRMGGKARTSKVK
jgi:hypothetical protein